MHVHRQDIDEVIVLLRSRPISTQTHKKVLFNILLTLPSPRPQKTWYGAIQVLRNAVGGGRVSYFCEKKRYEYVQFNVISITRGLGGCRISRKKRKSKTHGWPLDDT